jgi:rhamnogalacturonyl hydrolase YesR
MIIMTHGPDTCAAAHPEAGEMAREAMDQMTDVAKKHQVEFKDGWTYPPGHVMYVVVDAPNAHAASNFVAELRFFFWNTIAIQPVVTLEEAMKLAK